VLGLKPAEAKQTWLMHILNTAESRVSWNVDKSKSLTKLYPCSATGKQEGGELREVTLLPYEQKYLLLKTAE
jgi:hypothetical protein